MVRHPQQKFVADPTMTRSNTKKKNKMKKSVGKQIPTDFYIIFVMIILCLEALQVFCLEVLDVC